MPQNPIYTVMDIQQGSIRKNLRAAMVHFGGLEENEYLGWGCRTFELD